MVKGKNLNPADAHRKALRKKELKKNKAERSKAREFAMVKKDTHELEDEIEKLEAVSDPSAADKSRLKEMKAELTKVMAKKDEYVKEHPEHRKLVYRPRRDNDDKQSQPPVGEEKRNLFNKRGLPRHPERSIYYDPVMNPYGVPPPGMPYVERPLLEDEVASDEDNAGGSDDDIMMPKGPPPGKDAAEDDDDSDDDIPMPEGPPPSCEIQNLVSTPIPWGSMSALPPPLPPLPPFVPHYPTGFVPPPPPPPGFGGPPGSFPPFPPPMYSVPLPPPGFFPPQITSVDAHVSIPRETRLHADERLSASSKPPPIIRHPASSSAMISAAPELRDLKKEATAFVPSSLKRKKATAPSVGPKVNAAPSVGDDAGSEPKDDSPARPDLVSALKVQFGAPLDAPPPPASRGKDDYQKFLEEMNDILHTSKS